MRQLNILIVSGYYPYPAMHGGTFDIWERIKGIKSLNHSIDLVFTDKKQPKLSDKNIVTENVDNEFFVQRKNRLQDLFSSKPLQVVSRKGLKNVVLHKKYDYVILESDYVAEILNNKTLKAKKCILRSHNNEAVYFRNLYNSTSNFFKKVYYFQESLKFKNCSKKLYSKVDSIWFISLNELAELKLQKGVHMPTPIKITNIKGQPLNTKNILFVGSLFMPNNLEGLFWFLNNSHKSLLKKYDDYKLIIAGSTGELPEQEIVEKFKKYDGIELHLNKKDLDELYSKSSVFINPMLHGAGVKIKSINAIVNGLPLVSTEIGAEGIGLKSNETYLLANTPEDFTKNISDLFEEKINAASLVKKGQSFLKAHHYLKILEQELSSA